MKHLPSDWPFEPPLRFPAIDGTEIDVPDWWREGPGAWGCYQSHMNVIRDAIESRAESLLVFEDDAVFTESFAMDVRFFLSELPHDWMMLFLGGQLLETDKVRPAKLSTWVYRAYNVNRMHAYAIRSLKSLRSIYDYLLKPETWKKGQHIDHKLGEYQKENEGIYVPRRWIVGQRDGESDICGAKLGFRLFRNAEELSATEGR